MILCFFRMSTTHIAGYTREIDERSVNDVLIDKETRCLHVIN